MGSITGEVLVELLCGTERDEKSGKFLPSIAPTQVAQSSGLPLPLPRPSFAPSIDPDVLGGLLSGAQRAEKSSEFLPSIAPTPVPPRIILDADMSSPCVDSLDGALQNI